MKTISVILIAILGVVMFVSLRNDDKDGNRKGIKIDTHVKIKRYVPSDEVIQIQQEIEEYRQKSRANATYIENVIPMAN